MTAKVPTSKAKTAYALLSDVCEVIAREPLRLDMRIVCLRNPINVESRYDKRPACGTVGCIAGWALTLKGKTADNEANYGNTWDAGQFLGLSPRQQESLFMPRRLMSAVSSQQTKQHAERVVAHIRKFQQKYRAQLVAKQV